MFEHTGACYNSQTGHMCLQTLHMPFGIVGHLLRKLQQECTYTNTQFACLLLQKPESHVPEVEQVSPDNHVRALHAL